jgi:hypothetical protein
VTACVRDGARRQAMSHDASPFETSRSSAARSVVRRVSDQDRQPVGPQNGFRRWALTRPVSRPSRQPAAWPPAATGTGLTSAGPDEVKSDRNTSSTSDSGALLGDCAGLNARGVQANYQREVVLDIDEALLMGGRPSRRASVGRTGRPPCAPPTPPIGCCAAPQSEDPDVRRLGPAGEPPV